MASTTETGHAKNVANFYALISFCTGYGSQYNPSKPTLALAVLTPQHLAADTAVKFVNQTVQPHTAAVNARQAGFAPLNKLCTRVINSLEANTDDQNIIRDARALVDKIAGVRRTPKPIDPVTGTSTAYSASQQSFDMRLDHFDQLVKLLLNHPYYTPNETALQASTLQSLHVSLEASNNAVKDAYTAISNARIQRDAVLYHPLTGLVKTTKDVKKYVKSVFGAKSDEYAQVSALAFRVIKSK